MRRSRDRKPRPALHAAISGVVSGLVRVVLTWAGEHLGL
jgi:hypothetical protein